MDSPEKFIARCVAAGQVLWTYHVNMRLGPRALTRADIVAAAPTFEVVESYAQGSALPCFLVLGSTAGEPLHVVFAVDEVEQNVRVITAYRPDPARWSADFRTRSSP